MKNRPTLVIGPSCSGKSHLLAQQGAVDDTVAFAHELPAGPPTTIRACLLGRDWLHYNLLHEATTHAEPGLPSTLATLLSAGAIERAIVIVAPERELMTRAATRTTSPEGRFGVRPYDPKHWLSVLERTDLHRLYYDLFAALDANVITFEVLYSSLSIEGSFAPSDRVYVHANLNSRWVEMPPEAEIDRVAALPGCGYQAVDLPRGRSTGTRYAHLHGSRNLTFERLPFGSLRGKSLLDIGSANGDFLFRAERLGAKRVTGIEPHPDRFTAAVEIGKLLGTHADLRHEMFPEGSALEQHDVVTIMNVIHHVSDFEGFLAEAAALASEMLIIEFPLLSDPKFRSSLPQNVRRRSLLARMLRIEEDLDLLPLVGVSTAEVDQTHVFSRAAMRRIVMTGIGGFARCEEITSPIAERVIHIYHR